MVRETINKRNNKLNNQINRTNNKTHNKLLQMLLNKKITIKLISKHNEVSIYITYQFFIFFLLYLSSNAPI